MHFFIIFHSMQTVINYNIMRRCNILPGDSAPYIDFCIVSYKPKEARWGKLSPLLCRDRWKCAFGARTDGEGPDQTAQMCSLIRAASLSAARIIWYYKMYLWRANARMRSFHMHRMMWIRTICACSKALLRLTRVHIQAVLCEIQWYGI